MLNIEHILLQGQFDRGLPVNANQIERELYYISKYKELIQL